jgi:hypothetical protein
MTITDKYGVAKELDQFPPNRYPALESQQIPNDLADKIAFATFDVDQAGHGEICLEHKIRNIPFLAFYRDGSLIRSNLAYSLRTLLSSI